VAGGVILCLCAGVAMAIKLAAVDVAIYLGQAAAQVYLGQLLVSGGVNSSAFFTTAKVFGGVQLFVKSTTGYVGVNWWDNTSSLVGDGDTDTSWFVTKSTATASGSDTFEVYPSDSEGGVSGALIELQASGNVLTSASLSGLSSLTFLELNGNDLVTLNLAGLTAIQKLNCSQNTISSLNVSGLNQLQSLRCNQNNLTSLDVSGLPSLTSILCASNSLTSLRAEGVELSYINDYYYYYQYGSIFSGNDLDTAAIDQFFNDLEETDAGILDVSNNPGSATCDPTIATAKGYVVIN